MPIMNVESLLYKAIKDGRKDDVSRLLTTTDIGLEKIINATNIYGTTPLIHACLRGDYEIVQLLIDADADVNIADEKMRTPLHAASFMGYHSIVTLLIDKSADVDVFGAGRHAYAEDFDDNEEEEASSDDRRYAYAEDFDDEEDDGDDEDEEGVTALYVACQQGHKEVVKVLIDKGADANRVKRTGYIPFNSMKGMGVPLIAACYGGNEEIASILIQAGANIDRIEGSNMCSPAHSAISKGYCNVMKLLFDSGLNADSLFSECCINPDDSRLSTTYPPPIHFACARNSSVEMIKLFVEHDLGSKMILHRDGCGRLPLECFRGQFRKSESFRYLRDILLEEKNKRLLPLELAIWKARCISEGIEMNPVLQQQQEQQHPIQQQQRKRKRSSDDSSPPPVNLTKKTEFLIKSGADVIIPNVIKFLGESEFGLIEEEKKMKSVDNKNKKGSVSKWEDEKNMMK